MLEGKNICEKVLAILEVAKRKRYTRYEFDEICSCLNEHSDNLIIGKVFGYSVSEYAIATLKWLGTEESVEAYKKAYSSLSLERRNRIDDLVRAETYMQL